MIVGRVCPTMLYLTIKFKSINSSKEVLYQAPLAWFIAFLLLVEFLKMTLTAEETERLRRTQLKYNRLCEKLEQLNTQATSLEDELYWLKKKNATNT